MCCGCWENEYGSPKIMNRKVLEAYGWIKVVEEDYTNGLHAVIDDMNIEDQHLKGYGELTLNEKECAKHLRAMTLDERASALGLVYGCWDPGT